MIDPRSKLDEWLEPPKPGSWRARLEPIAVWPIAIAACLLLIFFAEGLSWPFRPIEWRMRNDFSDGLAAEYRMIWNGRRYEIDLQCPTGHRRVRLTSEAEMMALQRVEREVEMCKAVAVRRLCPWGVVSFFRCEPTRREVFP